MRISVWSADGCSSDLARDTTAWLPRRVESPGYLAGLANWYSFAIRPLYTGDGDHPAALGELFARLRERAARLTLYPVPDAEKDGIVTAMRRAGWWVRSEEHTSELQSLMRISYAVFCLKKKKKHHGNQPRHQLN